MLKADVGAAPVPAAGGDGAGEADASPLFTAFHRMTQAYLGDLISGEHDLEGAVDQFSDWRDFFVGSGRTAEMLADLNRRGR